MLKKVFDGWGCVSLRGMGSVRLWGMGNVMGGFADGPGSGLWCGVSLCLGLDFGM